VTGGYDNGGREREAENRKSGLKTTVPMGRRVWWDFEAAAEGAGSIHPNPDT